MREVRLRYVAQINPPTLAFSRLADDDELTFLPMESVWPGKWQQLSQVRKKADVAVGYTRFQDGDILVPKITPTFEASRSILVSGLLGGVGAGTTELHVVRPGPEIERRYLLYIFHTHPFLKNGEAEMYGVAGQQRVPDEFLRDSRVLIPSVSEQRRIADFLDAETARIDVLVRHRNRQLQLLQERALAYLSERLFPGILSDPLNEYPWTWLPKIQKDRPLVRLGYVCRIQGGVTVDSSRQLDGDVVTRPYLRVANVQDGRIDLSSVTEITVPRAVAARSTLRPGDVLMTEGGDIDKLGRGTVWHGELPGALHQNHVFALRPNTDRLDAEYLALLTRSLHGRCYFESTGVRSTNLASTSSSKVLAFPIPLPLLEQQRQVVAEIHRALDEMERAKSVLQRQIEVLVERRQALITAAVTGQFDVTTAGRAGEAVASV